MGFFKVVIAGVYNAEVHLLKLVSLTVVIVVYNSCI